MFNRGKFLLASHYVKRQGHMQRAVPRSVLHCLQEPHLVVPVLGVRKPLQEPFPNHLARPPEKKHHKREKSKRCRHDRLPDAESSLPSLSSPAPSQTLPNSRSRSRS
ncbi:hypothetical protein CRENBAI_022339 [Crenichthys baileyi]|uniref:Uncharacterized protein n=1 Tax=Crenichthys baileyi TaxID=28760 RepID=A0AAV9RM67_9TELE